MTQALRQSQSRGKAAKWVDLSLDVQIFIPTPLPWVDLVLMTSNAQALPILGSNKLSMQQAGCPETDAENQISVQVTSKKEAPRKDINRAGEQDEPMGETWREKLLLRIVRILLEGRNWVFKDMPQRLQA